MLLLGFSDYEVQGRRLADRLGLPYVQISVHRFPDGESLVTLPEELPEQVILYRSLNHPNEKLIELLLVTQGIRERGVKQSILVAPYLGYMRQDKAFNPGEVISQQVIGKFLAAMFDGIITVDAHLHRIAHLKQAIPTRLAINISASPAISSFLATRSGAPLLVGPDAESVQWVRAIAESNGLDYITASKERLGDRSVHVTLPDYNFRDRSVILIDDVASTGMTLISAANALKEAGVGSIDVLVIHALFADNAIPHLKASGVDEIWSTDSISHPSNIIMLDEIIAEAVSKL
jgi:ribose-phosphate pyrophosphokinase